MKQVLIGSICFVLLLLTGCFLPENQRMENRVAYPDQLESVQFAIKQFKEDTGMLPIRTFDENTSLYSRYIIEFNQLIPRYLQQPPGTAFENGGVFQYVLVNVEDEPQVKVIDLTAQKVIQQYQQRVNDYIRQNTYAPIKEIVDDGLFKLDHEELGYKEEPLVQSPYSDTFLPLLFTSDREVVIDYSIDLNMMLLEHDHTFKEGEDIRSILYNHSAFVPSRSVPYVLDENGEPAFAMNLRN